MDQTTGGNPPEGEFQELQKKLLSSLPDGIGKILRTSLVFYKAHFKPLLLISLLSTVPLLAVIFFYRYFVNVSSGNVELETRNFLLMSGVFDLLREHLSEAIILLSMPFVFKKGYIPLKPLLLEFVQKYIHRVVLITLILIGFLFALYQLVLFANLMLLFAHLYYVFRGRDATFPKSVMGSVKSVMIFFMFLIPCVLLINLITKAPEMLLLSFMLDGSSMDRFMESGDQGSMLQLLLQHYFQNYDFILLNTALKILIQPFKALFYCFVFLMIAKKLHPKELYLFFDLSNPKNPDSPNHG